MKSRDFDPLKLDIEPFAKAAGQLNGTWPLNELERLAESSVETGDAPQAVTWKATGESREQRGGAVRWVLHVEATTSVALQCQRCLNPVETSLTAHRSFLFVHGEEAAAALDADADSEEDVLALTHALDLRELIEDELLLSLPLVPRHDVCPEPLPLPADEASADEEKAPHPFAALAALKRGGLPN